MRWSRIRRLYVLDPTLTENPHRELRLVSYPSLKYSVQVETSVLSGYAFTPLDGTAAILLSDAGLSGPVACRCVPLSQTVKNVYSTFQLAEKNVFFVKYLEL